MITIGVDQFDAFVRVSERGFVEQLTQALMRIGHRGDISAMLARRAWEEGHRRGLEGEEEIAVFARILAANDGKEPAWSCEIVDSAAPLKAARLERCLAIVSGGCA